MRVVFSKDITLLAVPQKYGHSGTEDVQTAVVRGSVSMPNLTLKTNVESVGRQVDLVVQVWRRDFEKAAYTRAEYQGIRYRIESVTAGMNDLIVKLLLVRN